MKLEDRFLKFVDVDLECWNWTGALSDKGYGRFMLDGRNSHAHRVAYMLWVGEIPEGLSVCHKCDNPRCVRPQHLFVGSNSDNQQDSVSKGRHWQVSKTACANGHPYTEDNIYYRKGSKRGRICKICANRQSKETYERTKSL
jgi:hypothetical protein